MLHGFVKSRFPSIKLFYEKNTHKKVVSDYYLAIPYGKKYFAWFTYHKNENVCVLIEIKVEKDGKFNIVSTDIRPVCFHNSLAHGTILYGTMIPKSNFFCAENIFMYKNERVSNKSNKERLRLLEKVFTNEIKQTSIVPNEIIFGLPILSNSFKWLIKDLGALPYQIYAIQCKNFTNQNAFKMMYKAFEREEQTKETNVFNVTAAIGVDNYQLLDCKSGDFKQMAYIPNFQTSKLMNSIFRTIKENDNLDALEESDDEDEFENTSDDKFVDLNKCVKMECKMHPTFKKWVPFRLLS
jgi:hypothetical protein